MRTDYVSFANDEPMMIVHSYEPLVITKGTVIERPEVGRPPVSEGSTGRNKDSATRGVPSNPAPPLPVVPQQFSNEGS